MMNGMEEVLPQLAGRHSPVVYGVILPSLIINWRFCDGTEGCMIFLRGDVAPREMSFLIYCIRCKNPKAVAIGGWEWNLN